MTICPNVAYFLGSDPDLPSLVPGRHVHPHTTLASVASLLSFMLRKSSSFTIPAVVAQPDFPPYSSASCLPKDNHLS